MQQPEPSLVGCPIVKLELSAVSRSYLAQRKPSLRRLQTTAGGFTCGCYIVKLKMKLKLGAVFGGCLAGEALP